MRHFLCLALAPAALTGSMPKPPASAALVASPRFAHRLPSARPRARPRAVPLPAIAAAADLDRLTASSAEEPPIPRKDRPPPNAGRLDDPTATSDTAIAIALVAVGSGEGPGVAAKLQLGPSRLSDGAFQHVGTPREKPGPRRLTCDSRLDPPLRGGGGRQAGHLPPGTLANGRANSQKPAGSDHRQQQSDRRCCSPRKSLPGG